MARETENSAFNQVWYVGILKNKKTYYLLLLGDGGETPFFSANHKIVLCDKTVLLILKDYCKRKFFKISMGNKPVFKIDEKEIFNLVLTKDVDKKSLVLNTLNTFFDCAKILGQDVDQEYRESLFKLADHLTFDKDIKSFFSSTSLDRFFIKSEIERLVKFIWSNKVVVQNGNDKSRLFKFLFRFVFLFEKVNDTN